MRFVTDEKSEKEYKEFLEKMQLSTITRMGKSKIKLEKRSSLSRR